VSEAPSPGLLAGSDPDADPFEVAKQIVLQQLSHAPKTRHQLAQVLARRNVPDAAATAALDRITELGYIDDAAFARAWVESRHRAKGLSERVLRRELVQRGIAATLIDEALVAVDDDSERAAATELVTRKLRSMRGLDKDTQTRRLVGMLGRKGYPSGLAFSVVRDALDEPADGGV
jgi:regulatory protein